jgi:uncharacterized OB-fold protein
MFDLAEPIGIEYTCCVECGESFSPDNPCCCDDGARQIGDKVLHMDGVCVRCDAPRH